MIKDYPRCKTCKYYEIWREGLWASCTNENEGMAVSEDPYCAIQVPPDFGCVMHEEKCNLSDLIKDEISDEEWKEIDKGLADYVYGGPGLAGQLLTNKNKQKEQFMTKEEAKNWMVLHPGEIITGQIVPGTGKPYFFRFDELLNIQRFDDYTKKWTPAIALLEIGNFVFQDPQIPLSKNMENIREATIWLESHPGSIMSATIEHEKDIRIFRFNPEKRAFEMFLGNLGWSNAEDYLKDAINGVFNLKFALDSAQEKKNGNISLIAGPQSVTIDMSSLHKAETKEEKILMAIERALENPKINEIIKELLDEIMEI